MLCPFHARRLEEVTPLHRCVELQCNYFMNTEHFTVRKMTRMGSASEFRH
jgi:hypothetical protein